MDSGKIIDFNSGESCFTTADIAAEYGMSEEDFCELLCKLGVLERRGCEYILKGECDGMGYTL